MNLSEFCIRRPIFTTLLMLSVVVLGIVGFIRLPVNSLPDVDFPTIQITASLPGASPETMSAAVATPLERQLSTISGITAITSTSFLGSTQITVQFDLSRSLDGAALDVQTAISATISKLPKEMPDPPSFRKFNPADQPVIFIAVSSDSLPIYQVNEYADTILSQQISTLPGVAQVQIYGEQKYAVRMLVDPQALSARGLSFDQLATEVGESASITPAGTINSRDKLITLQIEGQPKDANSFKRLIIKSKDTSPVRLSDVGEVIDSVEDTRTSGFINGRKAVVLGVQRQPGTNTIEIVKSVRELLPRLEKQIPPSVKITPMFDRSIAIQDSIHELEVTLLIAIALVIMVIFLFLRRFSATVIPSIAIPLSIFGTLGFMSLLGFSINNISLLAITLGVGFVVDDAIVMLENIVRHVESGQKVMDAALQGSKEIGFTIISMTISLTAVFIPVLLMGGIVGRMFREFAVTISCSILVSGLVALTLTPMMCSRFLKDESPEKKSNASLKFQWLEQIFTTIIARYDHSLQFVIKHKRTTLFFTLGTLALTVALYLFVPKGFFPLEDNGFIFAQTESDQDISFEEMDNRQRAAAEIIQKDPAVLNVFSAIGGGRGSLNSGRLFFGLKPIGQRDSIFVVMDRLRKKLGELQGIQIYMQPIQNISVGGRLSKGLYQYTLQSTDQELLAQWGDKLVEKIRAISGVVDVSSDLQQNGATLYIDVDADRAQNLGISYGEIRKSLFNAFGSSQVGTLYTANNTYQIILEVNTNSQNSPVDINKIYIPTPSGQLIALNTFAKFKAASAPLLINHQGQMPAATISFNLAKNASLSEVVDKITTLEKDLGLPLAVYSSFQGSAQEFKKSAASTLFLLILSIVVIYIVLGMLYESFIHPVTILSGIPSAGIGALLALMAFRMNLDIIGIIGIILLVGIVKKNAIMMIDFALTAKAQGTPPEKAIYEACLIRFRPIMMTTFSAFFATLPIALGVGAGSELRRPLGICVVGGLLFSQIITLYITPVVFLYFEELSQKFKKKI